jgi:carbon-monoxide dehydrogenase large subunit
MSLFSSATPTYLYATLLSGQYNIPAIHANVKAIYTNTAPVDAYRGAGRPEATFVMERMMETAARQFGVSPAELRRKNFVTSFPHQTPVIMCYDAGDYAASLDAAMKASDYAGFAKRKAAAAKKGQAARHRHELLHRGLRHRAVGGGRQLGAGVGLWESPRCASMPSARSRC